MYHIVIQYVILPTYQPTNQQVNHVSIILDARVISMSVYVYVRGRNIVCVCVCVCVSVKSQVRYGTITYALNAGRGEVLELSRELMKEI